MIFDVEDSAVFKYIIIYICYMIYIIYTLYKYIFKYLKDTRVSFKYSSGMDLG